MNLLTGFCLLTLSLSVNGFNETNITSYKYTDICYGDLGCFTDRPPFGGTRIRIIGYLPDEPKKVNATFRLFNRQVSNEHISVNEVPVSYDSSLPTRFIIHGFIQNGEKKWIADLKDALLGAEDVNVISVDWSGGAKFPYGQAASNTQITGAEIARLVKKLVAEHGADMSKFHLIGHSLGAHVAGYAGERLENLGRITGLDPAGPLFEFTPPQVCLDPTDAAFVDVIHSDGGSILQAGLGLLQISGHVDFFPNGGVTQPNCPSMTSKIFSAIFNFATSNLDALDNFSGCAHVASIKFFTDSIENKDCYTAYPCSSKEEFDKGNCIECSDKGCNRMGFWASNSNDLGKQYLNTQDADELPFCTHSYKLTLFSDGDGQALGKFKVNFQDRDSDGYVVDDSETKFSSTTVSTHVASINDKLPDNQLGRIFVSYERTHNLFSAWLYSKTWSFKRIEVVNGETQTKMTFCPNGQSEIGLEPVEFILC